MAAQHMRQHIINFWGGGLARLKGQNHEESISSLRKPTHFWWYHFRMQTGKRQARTIPYVHTNANTNASCTQKASNSRLEPFSLTCTFSTSLEAWVKLSLLLLLICSATESNDRWELRTAQFRPKWYSRVEKQVANRCLNKQWIDGDWVHKIIVFKVSKPCIRTPTDVRVAISVTEHLLIIYWFCI